MWNKIAGIVLRNRLFIISIIIILTIFFGYFAFTGLKIDNKYGNMLPRDSEAQQNYLKFKKNFGEDGSALVIAIQNDSLYSKKVFKIWKELGDSILQFNGVESVISEATLFTIENNKKDSKFLARRIFSDVTYRDKSIDSIKKEIRNNPIYKGIIYNDSSNVTLMMVGLDEKYLIDKKKSQVVIDIENLAKTYENEIGKIYFSGLPHIRIIVGKRIINEMFIFIGLSILVTSILLYLFFKSFRVVLICNTIVFVAVIWSMGSIGLCGFSISILMALIPPLIIVIGIPNSIFLMTKYHQEVKRHGNKIKALHSVFNKIGTPILLTNFTAALGFSTFIFTNSEKLFEFGLITSVNIMVVFLVSMCLIPIIASLSKPPKSRHLKHLDRKFSNDFINKIIYLTAFKRKWIYIITIIVVVISIIGIFKIKATGNITGDLPKNDPILTDLQFIQNNFGGSIPFEMMINYKKPGRLFKNTTIEKIEEIQKKYTNDTLFSKSLSYVDFIKVINMAYYNNDPKYFKLISNRDKLRLKKYLDNLDLSNSSAGNMSIKELIDTANTTLRIRTQMRDIGSFEVADHVNSMKYKIDHILNPTKIQIEKDFKKVLKGKQNYIDSILINNSGVFNNLTEILSNKNQDKQLEMDLNPEIVKTYYKKSNFNENLRTAIDEEYFDLTITGTSVIASQGTYYLFNNLTSNIISAIVMISILMALLFRSWRIVLISMIPNIIPMIFTAGFIGWFGIPLKPSTLLVFSIALGISVDDTIRYLAKYRQELKTKKWDIKECVVLSIKESGLGIFYTSVVLFCGFSMFTFSQFGGTKSLGLLVSLTLMIAVITNLVVLPSLLLTLDRLLTSKSFKEPYFEVYDEDTDINWEELEVQNNENEKLS
jgi:predicted RND superfamily exporter protein